MFTEAYLEPCRLDEIGATDLSAEAESLQEEEARETLQAFRVRSHQTAEVGWMLHLPRYGRAGIAWGADALWTDCNGAEDALRRYLAEEMVN